MKTWFSGQSIEIMQFFYEKIACIFGDGGVY